LDIRFEGLREFDRTLSRADKGLHKHLRTALKDIAELVASEARGIASSKNLRDSGDLISGIKPFAAAGRAGVRSSARHRGYPYPRRLEFQGRGGSTFGPRASVIPAVDAKADQAIKRADSLLDRLMDDLSK
jgi:hypothetical protein